MNNIWNLEFKLNLNWDLNFGIRALKSFDFFFWRPWKSWVEIKIFDFWSFWKCLTIWNFEIFLIFWKYFELKSKRLIFWQFLIFWNFWKFWFLTFFENFDLEFLFLCFKILNFDAWESFYNFFRIKSWCVAQLEQAIDGTLN